MPFLKKEMVDQICLIEWWWFEMLYKETLE